MKFLFICQGFLCAAAMFEPPSLFRPSPFTNDRSPYAPHVSSHYVPPQSIGGGMMSHGGHVQIQNTYHPPQSIGGCMGSVGGWSQTVIPEPSPVIQTIIDVTALLAGGNKN